LCATGELVPEKKIKTPFTIQRLRNLQRGEIMTVYRGNFPVDLGQPGARKYETLLQEVYETMRQLEREGQIALHTENEIIGKAGNFVEIKRYLAIGLRGKL
jgi:hypothetical protein